ncbi:MAG: hypothetical protein HYV03_08545 [Deltaproteobacteria bacterium]|nr:hypothetical protein [Deltaproteobacteria bacterium]
MKKCGRQSNPSKSTAQLPEWERLISTECLFQSCFPECVLVGGTAAVLHAGHRISMAADYVLPDLQRRFAEILQKVEAKAGWRTRRIEPPVLILGHFQGIRTGIRQLMRMAPLETTVVRGLRCPTPEEILRIKAYLIVQRNATRDYIDFIALFDHLGVQRALQALQPLDQLYPQKEGTAVSQQLAMQLADPKPWDFAETDLRAYKALKAPYTDWAEVKRRAAAAGQKIIRQTFIGKDM